MSGVLAIAHGAEKRGTADRARALDARLLLVEDDSINADIASRMLQKLGVQVTVAENGLAALQSWREGKFDLVLMDCEMAEMDGFEATRLIREGEDPGSHTPIVALTAHSPADVREKCVMAGMDDVLAKPFKDRQVKELLERWIGTAGALPGSVPTQEPTAGAIDQKAFEAISAFQGPDGRRLLKILAERFAETAQNQLRALREKHDAGAWEEIRRIAHTLKSSSAALGASFVSQTCAEIERHAGDRGELPAFLSRLEEQIPSAVKELREIATKRGEGQGDG